MKSKRTVSINNTKTLLNVCGINDKNLRKINQLSGDSVYSIGNEIHFEGENSDIVEKTIKNLIIISENGGTIYGNLIELLFKEIEKNRDIDINSILTENIEINKAKKYIIQEV